MIESLIGLEALWLLLPVAAGTGWWAARNATRRATREREGGGFRSDYFQGINYLLNEQPDKAIEVFIKLIEVDSDTVETHLALGNLYRRRGDVDRAIRIHQNLVARESLSTSQRTEALLELGQDYMSAGVLDRAEDLFSEIAVDADYRMQALRQLIDIYEREKDWPKAIASARKLEQATGNSSDGSSRTTAASRLASTAPKVIWSVRSNTSSKRAMYTPRACGQACLKRTSMPSAESMNGRFAHCSG